MGTLQAAAVLRRHRRFGLRHGLTSAIGSDRIVRTRSRRLGRSLVPQPAHASQTTSSVSTSRILSNRFTCNGCEIGGFDRSIDHPRQDYTSRYCCQGYFNWHVTARDASADARRAYFKRTELRARLQPQPQLPKSFPLNRRGARLGPRAAATTLIATAASCSCTG